MTLNKAAWAIDGATTSGSLARTEAYAALQGSEGIVNRTDLKVSQLDVAGQGLKIAGGAGVVLNRYQSTPSQSYVIVNNGVHTVGSSLMPASNPAQQTYIVAIAVGDKEFSQAGHPFMLATDPPVGQEATFEYVRPIVVLESAFNTRAYPAIPLARLVIPANTTTITNAMLTDIRDLAQVRKSLEIGNVPGPGTANPLNGGGGNPGTYERWPNVGVLTVTVPPWASRAKITGFVEGIRQKYAGVARLRAYVEGTALAGFITNIDESNPATANDRRAYNFSGDIDVSSIAGTTKTFSVQATPTNTASKGAFETDVNTSISISVYFEEKPV